MIRLIRLLIIFILFYSPLSFAQKITHVIYITLDGTRWQDIFMDHTKFPKLWSLYANQGTFYGAPNSGHTMEVASIPVSLPSYHSQMAGKVQLCENNDCGRIQVETLAENILHRLELNKKEVATFASWPSIALSVEHIPKTTYVNAGNLPVYDPETEQADATMHNLNEQQMLDHPHNKDRYDKYTFAQALHYFEKYHPQFLWISFDDADDAAHAGDLKRYHQALSFYDESLDTLFVKLKQMKLDEQTLVIVTTDHGRGDGKNWTHHNNHYPESKKTWAFVRNGVLKPSTQEGRNNHYSTLSIRTTIENILSIA
ncbi:MAG: alkaline phosphatase family protein [Gammaproteobacteria bacterium]|nr:alkaline phosphatase family protein [Gammaproteobacteria bacterium]